MKQWRIFLSMGLFLGSHLGLVCGIAYIRIPEVQALIFFFTLLMGLMALSFAQDDGRERKRE